MLPPIEHCDSATPEPYKLALTPVDLSVEDYEVLIEERTAMEERYKEAISSHDEWKIVKAREAKEAHAEKLRQDKEVWAAKFKLFKQQKLEAEWKEAER